MPFIFIGLLLLTTTTVANENNLQNPLQVDQATQIPKAAQFEPHKLETLIRLIHRFHYLRPTLAETQGAFVDPTTLNNYLQSLDPYSKYIEATRNEYYQKRQAKEQIGLGINILVKDAILLAVPLYQGPAWKAGLKSPAYLITIKQQKLSAHDFSSFRFLVELLRGQKIPLQVSEHQSLKISKSYSVTVDLFNNPAIEYLTVAKQKIIRIHAFDSRSMTRQLQQFLHQAMQQSNDIILDLRYCPGGSLYEAIDAVSLFIPANLKVSYLRKHKQKRLRSLSSLSGKVTQNQQIYLWVSPFTASAAEIFAEALQRYANAILVGTITAGKCLSQQQFDFDDGSTLQLSVFEILDSNKQTCQGKGLRPDIAIEPDNILNSQYYFEKMQNFKSISPN
jgi:carboxyl-terminal processing protease